MCWEMRLTAFQPCILLMVRNTIVLRNIRKYRNQSQILVNIWNKVCPVAYFKYVFVITITPYFIVITGKLVATGFL